MHDIQTPFAPPSGPIALRSKPELPNELAAIGPFAPLVFEHDAIIPVCLLRSQITEPLTGDMEQSIRYAKDWCFGSSCLVALSQVVKPDRSFPLKRGVSAFGVTGSSAVAASAPNQAEAIQPKNSHIIAVASEVECGIR